MVQKPKNLLIGKQAWLREPFFPKNRDKVCDSLRLLFRKKQGGNDTNRFDKEIVAIVNSLLESKRISPTHHKKN